MGVDVGGTFTDFVWLGGEQLRVHKETTTRPQHRAVVRGLETLGVGAEVPVAHGTTAATNALLERRGARTALLTTAGFADVLVIGRQNRHALYDLAPTRPAPLVPAERRFEVVERIDDAGGVLTPLDDDSVRAAVDAMAAQDVESVAIVFLFSFQNPAHEERAAELVRRGLPGVPVTTSSALLPEYREYERTATTVVNAYVRPQVERYLERLDAALGARPVRVMQSNGGTIGLKPAAEQAARLALSGPAGGVVGALGLTRRAMNTDAPPIMTLDMGGTSTDVALCDGAVPRTAESTIAALPLRLPATDIHTVGAGGGSIASVDAGGSLRVGPESAGADPGPVCYGRGGDQPTVTDAHLVLGRLHPDHFLGGAADFYVDSDAARAALARLGRRLDRTPEEAALGVLQVANATMERALRRVSVERGHDPRDYVLVPFGGAGPLHAGTLAQALGMSRVLVPPAPGVLSALGLLMADLVYDTTRAVLSPVAACIDAPGALQAAAEEAGTDVRAVLENHGMPTIALELDLRYAGQSYEISVPLAAPPTPAHVEAAVSAFHERHRQRYGHAHPGEPVEVVALRVRGTVPATPPALPEEPPADTSVEQAVLGTRPVWFAEDGLAGAAIYARDRLRHGHAFEGPAVVHQYDSTIVVPPGWHARVDAWGSLWMQR